MNHHEPTSPEVDPVEEELVAYLDEELEPEHRAQVEHRLAEDARYRDKLRHMQKSWDMLDLLARSEPDEGFTRTTVAMVALKAKEATDVQKETTQRFSLLFKLGVAIGTLACLLIAYSVGSWLFSASDRQLVHDLPVIEHLDEYTHAVSVDFLRSLAKHGLFLPDAPEAADETIPDPAPHKPESAEQRRERLEKMTPEQKGAIAERKQRFEARSREEQEQLRKLAADIEADPQGEKLKQVLTNYHEWLKSLGAEEQSKVFSASADERLAKIKDAQAHQAAQRLQAFLLELSPEDVNAISVWLEVYVFNHEQEFAKLTPPQFRVAMERLPKHERIARHVWGIPWRIRTKAPLPDPTDLELDQLVSNLSPRAQEMLDEAENREQKWEYALEFINQVQQSKRFPRLSKEELHKFAASLPPEQRKALENKSADEMMNALRNLYYSQKASPPPGFYPWQPGSVGPPPPNGQQPKRDPPQGEPRGGRPG
jgi:hypothetical protein